MYVSGRWRDATLTNLPGVLHQVTQQFRRWSLGGFTGLARKELGDPACIAALSTPCRLYLIWQDPHVRAGYRQQQGIEHAAGWLKERRGIATCYKRLAIQYVSMLYVGLIGKYLSTLFANTA